MDINLILLAPHSILIGAQYYKPEENFNFKEFNVFLVFLQVQFKWGINL
jgi:hypothetical protein